MTWHTPLMPAASLSRRLLQLYAGLILFAFSEALIIRGALGVMPWDVLHQGLTERFGLSIGTWSVIVGVLVLLAWIPLRERPGLGTVSNALLIGIVLDVFLRWLPAQSGMPERIGLLVSGIVLNGIATGAYIGARMGPGPRDGLMTGLVRRTGGSVRLIRTGIEIAVVLVGWALGGDLGVGTVLFALAIGPICHWTIPWLDTAPAGRGD